MQLSKAQLLVLLCLSLVIITAPLVVGQSSELLQAEFSPMINISDKEPSKPVTPIKVNRNYLIETWQYKNDKASNGKIETWDTPILVKITNERLEIIDAITRHKIDAFINLGMADETSKHYNNGDMLFCPINGSDVWLLYYDTEKDSFILYNSFTESEAYQFNLSSKGNKS